MNRLHAWEDSDESVLLDRAQSGFTRKSGRGVDGGLFLGVVVMMMITRSLVVVTIVGVVVVVVVPTIRHDRVVGVAWRGGGLVHVVVVIVVIHGEGTCEG